MMTTLMIDDVDDCVASAAVVCEVTAEMAWKLVFDEMSLKRCWKLRLGCVKCGCEDVQEKNSNEKLSGGCGGADEGECDGGSGENVCDAEKGSYY